MNVDEWKCTIVYVADYGKGFGGAANTLLQQAVLMKQAKYNVILLFSDYYGTEMRDEYKEICKNLSVKYDWATYQLSSQPEDIDIICIDKHYEKLRDKIASYHPDILHSVQLNPCIELIGRELNIPHIMNIYPLIPDFFRIKYMDIFPHYHICDSWYWAERWNRYLDTDFTCIRTVACEASNYKERRTEICAEFICVGDIYKGKNQLSVIKAFHKALEYGIKGNLTLCGYAEGEYANECKQYVEENALKNEIVFKGFCKNMYAEYAHGDVLICGSTRESYPNVVSEAMANGLIIISTPVAGVPEIIKDDVNGYLTQDYSAEAICEKIIQVTEDIASGHIEKILRNAKKTFQKKHSPKAISEQLIKYYRYIIENFPKWSNENKRLKIDGLRTAFQNIIDRYEKHKIGFTDAGKVSIKLWYLYHIMKIVNEGNEKGKEFYIWGTGKYGQSAREMLEVFFPQLHISGFIDTNRTGRFCEYEIFSPNKIMKKKNAVIFVAAMNGQDEMLEQLKIADKHFNKDYFLLAKRIW